MPGPTASWSATPTSLPSPGSATFDDASTGSPDTWAWDFGDGSARAVNLPVTDATRDPEIDAMIVNGDITYIFGHFTLVNGVARRGAAAFWTATGELLPWDPSNAFLLNNNVNSSWNHVFSACMVGNTIYMGGQWSTYDPVSSGYIDGGFVAVDATTGARLNPATGTVYQNTNVILAHGGSIWLLGQFSGAAVKMDGTTFAVDSGFTPSITGESGWCFGGCLSPDGSSIYICGGFLTLSGHSIPYAGKISAATGAADTTFVPNPDSDCYGAAMSSDGLYVYLGGYFENIGANAEQGVAKVDATTGADVVGWSAAVQQFSYVNENPLVYNGKVWWCGGFQQNDPDFGDQCLVMNESDGALNLQFDLDSDGGSFGAMLMVPDGTGGIFVGGWYTSNNGPNTYNNLVRMDATTGVVMVPATQNMSHAFSADGTYPVTLWASNTSGVSDYEAPYEVGASSVTLQNGTEGVLPGATITFTPTVVSGSPTSWSFTNDVPAWVTIAPSDGLITASPPPNAGPAAYPLDVEATDGSTTGHCVVMLFVQTSLQAALDATTPRGRNPWGLPGPGVYIPPARDFSGLGAP